MKSSTVYVLDRKDFDLFVIKVNKVTYKVKIFGTEFNVKKSLIDGQPQLYVYVEKVGDELVKIFFDQILRWEYNFNQDDCINLVQYYKQFNIKTPWEEMNMFRNYIIESIEVGEINPIALKVSIEELIKSGALQGVSIEKDGDKTYLVKGSSVIDLAGEEFAAKVEDYVKGKTLSSLGEKPVMLALVKGLGLIKSVTLTKKDNSLTDLLG